MYDIFFIAVHIVAIALLIYVGYEAVTYIEKSFSLIIKNQTKMSEQLDALSQQVDDLQGTVNDLQQRQATAIKALQDLLDNTNGENDAKVQAISDKIAKIKEDLETTPLDGSDDVDA